MEAINEEKRTALESLLQEAIKSFVESMYAFKESAFNVAPFAGSWTAAETGNHINKSMQFIHQIVEGEVVPVNRNPEQHIPVLKQIMEDMATKGKSAPELLPDERFISRAEMRNDLTETEQLLLGDIRGLDLSLICQAMEFPGVGYLTRFELLSFAAFHVIRHTRQIQNIYKLLQENKTVI